MKAGLEYTSWSLKSQAQAPDTATAFLVMPMQVEAPKL
jgi:hypothetical protein